MKEQDCDWLVYHLLLSGPDQGCDALARKAGCSTEEIAASLRRLEEHLLIEKAGEEYRVLSIHEMLLKCQTRYDESLPFIIEGNTVRMKKEFKK